MEEARIALPMRVSPAALRRCDPERQVQSLIGEALGTLWQVRFHTSATVDLDRLRAAIKGRLATIVSEMSQWEPTSLLSRFNQERPNSWTPLPADFAIVLNAALKVAEASGGAFDPTYGRAAALLGYGAQRIVAAPTADELDKALFAAGWRKLLYDPATGSLRQPGGLWLDFAGVAKGFAVDAIADLLKSEGLEDALVEIGGELVARGLRPDGQPWWVDLETPPGAALTPIRIGMHENAIATSGDYLRGAHTIDPRTGRPLDAQVVAVTVVDDSAMFADAWATALQVLGPVGGCSLAKRLGLAMRMLVRVNGGVSELFSPALSAMMEEDGQL